MIRRTKHKVTQELETAQRIVAAGGVANVEGLQNELEGIGAQKEPERNPVAAAGGAIAGIGSHCQSILGQLGAITERCYTARDSGVLTEHQCVSVEVMLNQADGISQRVNEIWKWASDMVEEGIAVVAKNPVSSTAPIKKSVEVSLL